MTEINFGSTFRIPVTQEGINAAKKLELKELVKSYPNHIIGTGNTGFARVSIPDECDSEFLEKLKAIGYKIFKMFNGSNISKKNLDEHIRAGLAFHDYKDFGKKAKPPVPAKKTFMPPKTSTIREFENVVPEEVQIKIRQSEGYLKAVEEGGKEYADALYFFTRKI